MILVIKEWIGRHTLFILLCVLGLFQLSFLTKLPIFNDEAIYLDWGWRETHVPGFLFYSLYDAKQPLLMWVFGIAESLFKDPLFAGRFISVLVSLLSGVGMYKLSLLFLSKKYSLLTVVVFILTPLLFFYNRQALMESSMVCIGLWMGYYTVKALEGNSYKHVILLGSIAGLGYFIKSTTLIFLLSSFIIFFYNRFKTKKFKLLFRQVGTTIGVLLCIDSLLFLQPSFWQTLGSNQRYVLAPVEVITQNLPTWIIKITTTSTILFFGITPVILIFGIYGIKQLLQQKEAINHHIIFYFLCAFILQFVSARSVNSRYLVPFLGIFILFSMVGFYELTKNSTIYKKTILGLALFFLPIGVTFLQISSPRIYLKTIPLAEHATYLYGQTSGYGVNEVVDFLKSESSGKNITAGVALQSGNPESSVIMYFQKDKKIHAGYFDSEQIAGIEEFDCLLVDNPTYFISRNEQLVGFDKFLVKVKTVHQEGSDYTIGIYKIKSPCNGRAKHIYEEKT